MTAGMRPLTHPIVVDTDAATTAERARRIRVLALKMVARARASHIGAALSIADLLAVLYGRTMRHDPSNADWAHRDRLLLSKGHACVAVYAALADAGYFPIADLNTYGADGSPLMNHISHKVTGVEFSTGSLGHGLPFATGKALAARRRGADWRTFVILGDGEMAEGSNWEAMMFASHHGLDNLVAIVDANNLQSLTTVAETLALEPLAAKAEAFGWAVRDIDGHDHTAIADALDSVAWTPGKPSLLIARTVKGKGVGFMENSVAWHYKSPDAAQLAAALVELGEEPTDA